VDAFIGIAVAILCVVAIFWIARARIKAAEILGKEAGEAFVRDAKINPNNPMYGAFHLPSQKNDDPRL
jgi:hypothetical protein